MGKRLRTGAVHANRLLTVKKSDSASLAHDSWKKLPRKEKQKLAKKMQRIQQQRIKDDEVDHDTTLGSGSESEEQIDSEAGDQESGTATTLNKQHNRASAAGRSQRTTTRAVLANNTTLQKKKRTVVSRPPPAGARGLLKQRTGVYPIGAALRQHSAQQSKKKLLKQQTAKLTKDDKKTAKRIEDQETKIAYHNTIVKIPEYKANPLACLKQHLLATHSA
ncbi:unnamed protein product [Amoebophrya sp. A120]|nr:unnamed protein product [Amoebophrya sp. A120]|eukprot:GSA120T00024736001.1